MSYKLKELRKERGITQSELARISGVSVRTIRELENRNGRATTVNTLVKLAASLGSTIGGIFGECETTETAVDASDTARRRLNGALGEGLVVISDAQFNDLCARLSLEELHHYFSVVAENERAGRRYRRKTHYRAILDMAKNDRKTQKK